jgi:hypothetical protein
LQKCHEPRRAARASGGYRVLIRSIIDCEQQMKVNARRGFLSTVLRPQRGISG